MKRFKSIIIFCITLLFSIMQINISNSVIVKANTGTTYYVDSIGGNDNNLGTSELTPWKTLDKVNSITFIPGDKILLKAGSKWTGQLWPKGSGTAGKPIILDSYGQGNKPIISGNGTTYPAKVSGAVMLYNQEYWEINNIDVSNYNETVKSNRAGILAYNTSGTVKNHIYIKNCYVHDVNSDKDGYKITGGIVLIGINIDKDGKSTGSAASGYNDALVESNHVKDVSIEGIRNKTVVISGTSESYPKVNSNIIFRNNFVEEILGDGMVLGETKYGGLIEKNTVKNYCNTYVGSRNYAGCWVFASDGAIMQHNEVYGGKYGFNDGEAFDIDLYCKNTIVQYNYSHDNKGGFCLFMDGSTGSIFRYNLSVNDGDNTGSPVRNDIFFYLPTSANSAPLIYNNTIYSKAGIKTTLFDCTNKPYIKFFNNIVEVHGNMQFSNSPVSGEFSNNVIYNEIENNTNKPSSHPGLITSNPLLMNPGEAKLGLENTKDYTLRAESPAIDKGRIIANNGGMDYYGNLLDGSPVDIGYFEYGAKDNVKNNKVFEAVEDGYVRDGIYSDKNYSNETELVVKSDAADYARKSYVSFDLSNYDKEKASSTILRLFVSFTDKFPKGQDSTREIKVYEASDINEETLTWKQSPAKGIYIGSISINDNDEGNWVALDLTNYLNNNNTKSKKLNLLLVNEETPNSSRQKNMIKFSSREGNVKPQLIVKEK
ncbi:hypothetical protein SAMN02745163_04283 [Clostridium cavendishii DSM 21758]|uniref:Carbohydrate-binding module family 96 domain-containing protein n=1 Tax=Clostridium cavendishii DSM 21758 TaxID=1121302 RepID=A0A1M6UIR8_9CLOT|nr:DNRLRE domain-containing protein [Clostridium cavendishii]SHK68998.1 hypothetical protein SAMN02745163_04283 [Clostridium cavendishii DSM 21758]